MIKVYPVADVAREILEPLGWTDGERWLKRRIKAGVIPGKRLSRNKVVMTDKHIEDWLNGSDAPEAEVPAEPVSIVDGLAAHRRAS